VCFSLTVCFSHVCSSTWLNANIIKHHTRTIIDDTRHDWEKGGIILLPIKSHGVVHQHFNIDATQAAKLLVAEPNWVDVWGVDIGSGWILSPN